MKVNADNIPVVYINTNEGFYEFRTLVENGRLNKEEAFQFNKAIHQLFGKRSKKQTDILQGCLFDEDGEPAGEDRREEKRTARVYPLCWYPSSKTAYLFTVKKVF